MIHPAWEPPVNSDLGPSERFDPQSRRNPDVPAVPVVLSDGRTWHFASATERHRPVFEGDRFVGVETYRGFPPPCDRHVEALTTATRENPDAVPINLIMGGAVSLLRKAHNLSAPEAAALLHVSDQELTPIISAIARAYQGPEPDDAELAALLADSAEAPQ